MGTYGSRSTVHTQHMCCKAAYFSAASHCAAFVVQSSVLLHTVLRSLCRVQCCVTHCAACGVQSSSGGMAGHIVYCYCIILYHMIVLVILRNKPIAILTARMSKFHMEQPYFENIKWLY